MWTKEFENLKDPKLDFVLINSPSLFDKYNSKLPTEEQFESDLETLGDYVKCLQVRKVHLLLSDIKSSDEMYAIIKY